VRPTYPDAVFDDIVELGALSAGARILEIGCGTGQATLPFARRGFDVVCVELGAGLAAFAQRKLAEFDHVEIVNADFETWEPAATFDAVVAFTSFHWIAPELRYAKPARLLREDGVLAVVETQHVRDDNAFWLEVQDDYDAIVPDPKNAPPPLPEEIGDLRDEIDASGFFRTVGVRKHLTEVVYSTDEYMDTLATYSPNIALADATRARLFARIRARVDLAGGQITKPYLYVVNVARRVM
jgi:SAM-dependent methyltransferase